jgi:Predicted acetyltransferases and hydrolases with the alpha/beta hydrolase fold
MLARMVLLNTLVELAIYGAVAVLVSGDEGWSSGYILLFVLSMAIGVRALIVGISFILSWIYRAQRPRAMCIGLVQTLRLCSAEFRAVLAYFPALLLAERWLGQRVPAQEAAFTGLPVLLIHGLKANGAYWWPMRRYLARRGINNIFTINLEPICGSIQQLAEQVKQRVEQICTLTGAEKVLLVAHSMGGLVSRAYLYQLGGEARVAKLITLGSPHHGTELARLLAATNIRQMRPGNPWLEELNRSESQPAPVPITSIYSYHDNIVVPQDSPALGNAKNVPIAGVGHLEMAFSKPFQERVYEEIVNLNYTCALNLSVHRST